MTIELYQAKKDRETLTNHVETLTSRHETIEQELKEELRSTKTKIGQLKLEFSERIEQEQSISRKKALEIEKKSQSLDQVSLSLTSHLQAFRCKEAEFTASREDMQG